MSSHLPLLWTGPPSRSVHDIWMVLVDGEQETEPESICLAKYKETNNTSNPCLHVFSFFPD